MKTTTEVNETTETLQKLAAGGATTSSAAEELDEQTDNKVPAEQQAPLTNGNVPAAAVAQS